MSSKTVIKIVMMVAFTALSITAKSDGASTIVKVNKANLAKTTKDAISVSLTRSKSGMYTIECGYAIQDTVEIDRSYFVLASEKQDAELMSPLLFGKSSRKVKIRLHGAYIERAFVRIDSTIGRNTVIYMIDLASFLQE